MTKRRETMTIRVTPRTNAAINVVVSKLKAAQPGARITQDDAIWHLIQIGDKEAAEMISKSSPQSERATDN